VGVQTPPPAPVTLTAAATFTNVLLSWGGGFKHDLVASTEVYRSTSNSLATASHIGSTSSFIYTDTVEPSTTNYYWVRFRSPAGVAGPYNATDGTIAVTSKKVSDLFVDLNDSFPADGFKISGGASDVIPFAVVGNATYINTALIADASIDVAKIANLVVDMASVTGTLTASQISAGLITSDMVDTAGISADKIMMDGNIEFSNSSSGVHFGKTSLGDQQAGAFFGRSGGVAGFNISSSSSGIYADSTGQVALNNVRLYTGSAGSAAEYTIPGTYTSNISAQSTSIAVIIVGGGCGSSNNAAGGSFYSQLQTRGSAGSSSWIKWYSGLNGTGSVLGTYTAAGGANQAVTVTANNGNYPGYAGQASSQAAGGAGAPTGNSGAGSPGTKGSGGGGGGGSPYAANAGVTTHAKAGTTFSQLVAKPSNAQSVKMFVGTGGAGGTGHTMHYNNNSGNWTGFSVAAGARGGDGFVSIADPNSGGIEVDLLSIVNRLNAAGI
jgi:hypothetical protein